MGLCGALLETFTPAYRVALNFCGVFWRSAKVSSYTIKLPQFFPQKFTPLYKNTGLKKKMP